MRVTIVGNASDGTFRADEIDTPYHIDYVAPIAGYWGGGPFLGGAYWGPRFGAWY